MWSSHGLLVFSVFLVPFKIYWNSIVGGLWNFPFFTNNGTNLSHWVLIKKVNNKFIANIGKSKCVFTNYFIISILNVLEQILPAFCVASLCLVKQKYHYLLAFWKGCPEKQVHLQQNFFFNLEGIQAFCSFTFLIYQLIWFWEMCMKDKQSIEN